MDSVDELRRAIAAVFAEWEELPRIPSDWKIEGVSDEKRDRYVLQHVDFGGEQYRSHLLAHLEIRNGKIWILTDNTEEGVASDLMRQGVSNRQIVRAFHPPAIREIGEFAVAQSSSAAG